ncbi:hypothetical protein EVAR_100355_1 [Eumeta japonica]|uniref:Uncharacterized protein n=1 Tax=Eumeta variegata TaxID=151549 RepID=A0A4C2ADJ2_EUMVA|nr:hypothetical protein EVAR_100355_1 [Eumeta japonica]
MISYHASYSSIYLVISQPFHPKEFCFELSFPIQWPQASRNLMYKHASPRDSAVTYRPTTSKAAVLTDLYALVSRINEDCYSFRNVLRSTYRTTRSTQQPVTFVV